MAYLTTSSHTSRVPQRTIWKLPIWPLQSLAVELLKQGIWTVVGWYEFGVCIMHLINEFTRHRKWPNVVVVMDPHINATNSLHAAGIRQSNRNFTLDLPKEQRTCRNEAKWAMQVTQEYHLFKPRDFVWSYWLNSAISWTVWSLEHEDSSFLSENIRSKDMTLWYYVSFDGKQGQLLYHTQSSNTV